MGGGNSKPVAKKLKLVYFDGYGRGEQIRLTFALAGISFHDERVSFEDWPSMKEKTPWGSLPYLEADGKVIGQSLAVSRYAAKLAGIYGDTAQAQAKADAVVDVLEGTRELLTPCVFGETDEAKAAARETCAEKSGPIFANLEKALGADNYFGGSKLCYADLHLLVVFDAYKSAGCQDAIEKNKQLMSVYNRVAAIPRIKKHIETRPPAFF